MVKFLEPLLEALIHLLNKFLLGEKLLILQRKLPVLPYWENGIVDIIGNTPMIKLPHLSKLTGCNILVRSIFYFN